MTLYLKPSTTCGEIIQRALDELGWSQTEAARRAGITAVFLNQVMHGHRRMRAPTALALARVLGVNARELLIRQADMDLYEAWKAGDDP